jgi:hypothetical protein
LWEGFLSRTLSLVITILFSLQGRAAVVERLSATDEVNRLSFIQKGLAGQLHTPEQQAQFHLLLCQPRAAWKAAEKIKDEKTKAIFKGTILALAATPRPAEEQMETSAPPIGIKIEKNSIATEFNLEQEEVWNDEIADLSLGEECDFPMALKQRPMAEEAKEIFDKNLSGEEPTDISVFALASDVGLQPVVGPEALKHFSEHNEDSLYLKRLKFFADQSAEENEPEEINIKGMKAWSSAVSLKDATFSAHRLEIPWLLHQ